MTLHEKLLTILLARILKLEASSVIHQTMLSEMLRKAGTSEQEIEDAQSLLSEFAKENCEDLKAQWRQLFDEAPPPWLL